MVAGSATYPTLEWIERKLFRRRAGSYFGDLIRETHPVAGLSTSCVVEWERPLFEAMQAAGIPTLAHILSFDNLTSRGYIPIRGYDRFLAWSQPMTDELCRFYGADPSRVSITGTPQFDFHVAPEFRWSRTTTTAKLGLDESKPYFVYCANHQAITPTEPVLVDMLLARAACEPLLHQYQWVVRLHPMDCYGRWESLRNRHPEVRWELPWQHDDTMAHWAIPTRDDVARLGNTLRFAAAVVNVASTIALDAAIVDTPIVAVGCHPGADPVEGRFYHDAHWSHHYRPISESGAAPVGTSLDEVVALILEAVTDRQGRQQARQRLVREICGPVDGASASRIADAIYSAILKHPL